MTRTLRSRILSGLARDGRGASAIEFALLAPVLASGLVLAFDCWSDMKASADMKDAVQTAVRYYQNGGTTDSVAQAAGLSAWTTHPPGSSFTVTRTCSCGPTQWSCSSYCTGSTPPLTYVTIAAHASYSGPLLSNSLNQQELVRVR